MKNKDKLSKPTSAGRVAGKGLSTKWSSYYNAGGRKQRLTSSESQSREVQELRAQVAQIPKLVQEQVQQQVQQQLGSTLTGIMPTLIHGLTTWIASGQQGPPPIPSFTASNSHNAEAAPLVSPTPARALELNAPACTPAGTSAASGPSVNCTPAVGGASTLAELDAIITVTN